MSDSRRHFDLDGIIADSLRDVPATGYVAAVGRGHDILGVYLAGSLFAGGNAPAVDRHTSWDLASLTKVLITAPLLMEAVSYGEVRLDQPIGEVVRDFRTTPIGAATFEQLATHTAGLPAELPENEIEDGDIVGALARQRRQEPDQVLYSDVGYIALGFALEEAAGTNLDDLAKRRLGTPPLRHVAEQMTASTLPSGPSDGRPHDPVARAAGRLLGHAGAFADIDTVARLLARWIAPSGESAQLYLEGLRSRTDGMEGGRRGIGWCLEGDPYAIGASWPAATVSHTGFTGTAVIADPQSTRWAAILTNAVVAGNQAESIRSIRRFAQRLGNQWFEGRSRLGVSVTHE